MYIRNVLFWNGHRADLLLSGEGDLDGSELTAFPGGIDGHVHFRTPGFEYKEDWKTGSAAAVAGGVTTVFDMPNTQPFTDSISKGREKEQVINKQLAESGIPLNYKLYLGASKDNLAEIEALPENTDLFCGVKVFMGSSTAVVGGGVNLSPVFRTAAEAGVVVAVHAEDETVLQRASGDISLVNKVWSPEQHSLLRPPEAAYRAVETVLDLSAKHGTKLYVLHIGTAREVELIDKAKRSGINVYAEAALPHLFFDVRDYEIYGNAVKVNPPLRTPEDREALWDAIRRGIIDTVGSDHAPHLHAEKTTLGREVPSGMPGVQFLFPLLLNAVYENKITREKLVQLTGENLRKIFSLSENRNWVLVKEHEKKTITDAEVLSKCAWSPYVGRTLVGWPMYSVLNEQLYHCGSPGIC